ncbi:AraC family transcriptional regulator [Nocardiopsis sp. YSL2]|uniref:AraC family transcriptional regulator n=1 Tax=Nocardiopsis sp. YSL2 TaxID=2939492 RepID=UPI0026F43E05|nr:AraC family transcriptional regulator [Nocardiopsis sp. YSL2]
MDVLSDVITTVRTGRPVAARVEWYAPWGLRLPGSGGGSFQVVLQGSSQLFVEGEEPRRLAVGDVVFLPHGQGYTLADSPGTPVTDLRGAAHLSEGGAELGGGRPGAPVADLVCGREGLRPFRSAAIGDRADGGVPACVTVGGSYHSCTNRRHPLLTELPRVVHLPHRVGARPELAAAVDLLGGELDRPREGSDAIIPSLLDMLLLFILRAYLEEQGQAHSCGWVGALRDPAVSAAVRAVHEDPAHPWSVAELGERAGLSRAAFSKRFTGMVGQSPLAYVTWWRLTIAAHLLRKGDLPLSAIAAQVGYGSQFAFANAFKREFGLPPGRYRAGAPPEEGERHVGTANSGTHTST